MPRGDRTIPVAPHERLTVNGRYGRVDALLRRLPDGPIIGAEVGVWRGDMSAQLLRARPDLWLYMVDSWLPQLAQPVSYRQTRDSHAALSPRAQRLNAERARRAVAFADGRHYVMHQMSLKAARNVPHGGLHFVFLDADHSFEGVTADIEAWRPTLRPGGLLCGHDYGEGYEPMYDFGVVRAVDAAVERYGWTLETDEDSTWFVRV
jgi:hypothetical protein